MATGDLNQDLEQIMQVAQVTGRFGRFRVAYLSYYPKERSAAERHVGFAVYGDEDVMQRGLLSSALYKKLKLRPGMRLLDIGCGWGGLAHYATERYNVSVVGVTVAKNQVNVARQRCKGLPVEIRLQDYRDLNEEFDRIISIGMFEHVGYKNYRTYMNVVNRCLKPNGLFLLHTIGGNTSVTSIDPWMGKYIFPNAMLPSAQQITKAAEGFFVLEDWHSFGTDYDKTLMAWHANFTKHWHKLKTQYDARFYRMWTYYLLSAAASFRARKNQLWQIVLSKGGVRGGYASVR